MHVKEFIAQVVRGEDLSMSEAEQAMNEIINGGATDAQIASLLTALRMKGETADEITGCAKAIRCKATRIDGGGKALVDTCGTGGDGADTFNISTTTAFVVAGAGVPVAKHGNRAVSSISGSADVLEALGVKIDLDPAHIERCIDQVGIGFLFAPLFHKAMKNAMKARQEVGIRTIFNILGPLCNPAGTQGQLIGVYNASLTEPMAMALGKLGVRRALVVHGMDGLDEITITAPTKVTELREGEVVTYCINPQDFGISLGSPQDLRGGTAAENAEITRSILRGNRGPRRDVVLLNASAALVVAGKVENMHEGIEVAAKSIDSGAALNKLEMLCQFSRSVC